MKRSWPVVLALVVAACTGGVPPTPAPPEPAIAPMAVAPTSQEPAGPSAGPSAEPSVSPAPSPTVEPLPSDLPPEIAAAIAWRLEMGLRADPEWVAAVHADPTAVDQWAYPILPEEDRFIWDRQQRLEPVVQVAMAYGRAHPDVFGGLYMDNAHSRVMTLWTEDPDGHLAAMLAEAGPDAALAATLVRWSERELRAVQRRIRGASAVFDALDARPMGWGASISDNRVEIEVSSASPDGPQLIAEALAAEFGVPAEMFFVESDGTGVELLDSGWVEGVVVTSDGSRPKGGWNIDGDPVTIGYCGGGDIGYGIGRDGSFRIPCKTGDYRMQVWVFRDGRVVLGESAVVTVRDGRTSHVRIRVER